MPEAIDRQRLRAALAAVAASGGTRTYQQVAADLDLRPPRTIQRLACALEDLMAEDVMAGRPLLAAVVVSRAGESLPAPGFFARACQLGRYQGPERGPQAAAFHAGELAAVHARHAAHSRGR